MKIPNLIASVIAVTGTVAVIAYRIVNEKELIEAPPPEETLDFVRITAARAPVDRAHYEAHLAAVRAKREARADEDFDAQHMIPEFLMRHEMLAAEYGRIKLDVPAQEAPSFLGEMSSRFRFYYFEWNEDLPTTTWGPLKGTFTYDEALDAGLKGTGCSWHPSTEYFIRVECDPSVLPNRLAYER